MKKSFCVFFSIVLLLIGASISFSWRGYDNDRWTNRDEQTETSGVWGVPTAWVTIGQNVWPVTLTRIGRGVPSKQKA